MQQYPHCPHRDLNLIDRRDVESRQSSDIWGSKADRRPYLVRLRVGVVTGRCYSLNLSSGFLDTGLEERPDCRCICFQRARGMSVGIPVVPFEEKDSGWAGVMWQYLIEKCEV